MTTTEGVTISLDDLRGRPVWVNFWSTTCPACVYEMPIMEGKYQEHRASGLEIVGIAVGNSTEEAVAFGEALGISYPLAIDSPGVGEGAAVDYQVFFLPTHYFIDSAGIVRGFVMGDAPPEAFDERVARIVGATD